MGFFFFTSSPLLVVAHLSRGRYKGTRGHAPCLSNDEEIVGLIYIFNDMCLNMNELRPEEVNPC